MEIRGTRQNVYNTANASVPDAGTLPMETINLTGKVDIVSASSTITGRVRPRANLILSRALIGQGLEYYDLYPLNITVGDIFTISIVDPIHLGSESFNFTAASTVMGDIAAGLLAAYNTYVGANPTSFLATNSSAVVVGNAFRLMFKGLTFSLQSTPIGTNTKCISASVTPINTPTQFTSEMEIGGFIWDETNKELRRIIDIQSDNIAIVNQAFSNTRSNFTGKYISAYKTCTRISITNAGSAVAKICGSDGNWQDMAAGTAKTFVNDYGLEAMAYDAETSTLEISINY